MNEEDFIRGGIPDDGLVEERVGVLARDQGERRIFPDDGVEFIVVDVERLGDGFLFRDAWRQEDLRGLDLNTTEHSQVRIGSRTYRCNIGDRRRKHGVQNIKTLLIDL